jgi:tryptophan-rich sensory protein
VFSPVWTALYVAMAVAGWLVAREGTDDPRVRLALGLFAGQLVLNALWTPIFFGAEQIDLALVDIAALLMLLIVTTAAFWRVSRPAAGLMVPYVAWVAFATALNAAIAAMN